MTLLLTTGAECQTAGGQSKAPPQLTMLGTIRDRDITESSGLAISGAVPDAFWTHNDSGHASDLYLIATKGHTLAHCKLKQARNLDWEAMAEFRHDDQSWLMVADVGDNSLNRSSCQLYFLPEPDLAADGEKPKKKKGKKKKRSKSVFSTEVKPLAIEFQYSDGKHNVEAAAVSPNADSVWFIEKIYTNDSRPIQPGIYRLPIDLKTALDNDPAKQEMLTATRIADFPIRNVTGMAFSPDGRRLIVRNYLNAHLYTRPEDRTWQQTVNTSRPVPVAMPLQSQGEAICFTADSKSAIVTSEFARSAIWKIELPLIE